MSRALRPMAAWARWAPAALLAAIALAVAATAPLVSPDSVYYVDTARQLAAGRGPVTDALHLGMPSLPAPAGLWPTLYPEVLAVLVGAGVPSGRAPAVLNALAALALGAALLRLARRCVPAAWAWPVALLGVAHPFCLSVLHFAWSEPLFMAFTYACLAVLVDAARAPAPAPGRCAAAGALAGAAFATRYAGLFLLGFVLASLVVVAWRRRWSPARAALALAAAAGAFVVPAVPAVLPNLRTYGSPFGLPRLPVASLGDAALARARDLAATGAALWLPIAAALALSLLALRRHGSGPDSEAAADDGAAPRDDAAWLLAGWGLFYTAALFVTLVPYVRSEHLDERFLAPVAPAAVLAVAPWLARRRPRARASAAAVASLAALAAFAFTAWRDAPRGEPRPDPLASWALAHRDGGVFVGAELWSLRDRADVVVLTDGYPEMPALRPAAVRDFLGRQGAAFRRAHLVFAVGALEPAAAPAWARALAAVGFHPGHADRLADGSVVVTLER